MKADGKQKMNSFPQDRQSDNKMTKEQDIRYCVCAMIDLLGFSSHLEISGYDLRTSIGEQAVKRLENLEKVLHLLNSEKERRPDYYPNDFHVQRINDTIFLTMDLDDILKPSIGGTIFQGLSANDSNKYFTEEQMETLEKYQSAYASRILIAIEPLIKFVGFVSRLHITINELEGQNFFPGAKTVISTGFRRPFMKDYFSANFALSNAYQAEKSLHGSSLYLDNGILQMVSFNKYAKNLLRFAHFQFKKASFDCFDNHEDVFSSSAEANIPEVVEIKLFRKEYHFRQLNPSPLTYLQNLSLIMPYLTDEKKPDLSNIYYKHIYHAIKRGITRKKDGVLKPPPSFIFNGTNDLNNDIGILYEFLSTGKSKTREDLGEKKFNEENANVSEEGKRKIKELLNQEVEIDIEKIKIEDCKNQLFGMTEETLTGLMLMLDGDLELLDYRDENEESA